jgi:hypothetical protein
MRVCRSCVNLWHYIAIVRVFLSKVSTLAFTNKIYIFIMIMEQQGKIKI